jgi:hypothetical protein
MSRIPLTPDQQAEADRIRAAMLQAAEADIRELAELLATKDDRTTFGAAEFTYRDIILRVGAKAVEAALEGRKKGGTTAPREAARTAASRPSSSAGRRSGS